MTLTYHIYDSTLDVNILDRLQALHKTIFGEADDLSSKMTGKPPLVVVTAMDAERIIGYKIGYPLDNSTFYSWLGGVDPRYRNHGIASTLMKKQHHYLGERGYKVVQTKTMNKWRGMLVLNIKSGFDVVATCTDEKGLHKIILEKHLVQSANTSV